MKEPGDITRLLQQAAQGDPLASDQLYHVVRAEIRAIAAACKNQSPENREFRTTHLIDSAFLKVVQKETDWQAGDRKRFYSWMAIKMHDLLIETTRKRCTKKRGGEVTKISMEGDDNLAAESLKSLERLIDIRDALQRFEVFSPQETEIFRSYVFLKMTFAELAERLEISESKAKRSFQRAQLWLKNELKDYRHDF